MCLFKALLKIGNSIDEDAGDVAGLVTHAFVHLAFLLFKFNKERMICSVCF